MPKTIYVVLVTDHDDDSAHVHSAHTTRVGAEQALKAYEDDERANADADAEADENEDYEYEPDFDARIAESFLFEEFDVER